MTLRLSDFEVPKAPINQYEELLAAIAELRLAMSMGLTVDYGQVATALEGLRLPAPVVHVEPADLSEVVEAIQNLKQPQADVDALVERLLEVLPKPDESIAKSLKEVSEALEKLDFRMKGIKGGGGGGPSNQEIETRLGTLHVDLQNILRATSDQEVRLDYTGGPTGSPTYVGKALNGTATSGTWNIQKLTYDGDNLTRVQIASGAWDNRASLF